MGVAEQADVGQGLPPGGLAGSSSLPPLHLPPEPPRWMGTRQHRLVFLHPVASWSQSLGELIYLLFLIQEP